MKMEIDEVRFRCTSELAPYSGRQRLGLILQVGSQFHVFDCEDVYVTTVTRWQDGVAALRASAA